jgi:molybdate transport system regulatory protein
MTKRPVAQGSLWLLFGGRRLFERNGIELLRAIDRCGSITGAARAAGVSYRTAWDIVDRLNNLSARPLVTARIGGAGGGGCTLSAYGKNILDAFDSCRARFDFAAGGTAGKTDFDEFATFARSLLMKTSARNQFAGTVESVVLGPVSAEVVLRISDEAVITSVITGVSVRDLGLEKGVGATALIKASSVILMQADAPVKVSARNRLCGTVASVLEGAVNDEVKVSLAGGRTLFATITKKSAQDMKLEKGTPVCAVFKASQVILAVAG